tara:strand:+ start:235 stop:516 length:282 start_codon:yes stop_codon:yes gene_type:complete
MINSNVDEEVIKLSVLYFELRNTFNLEFQKYGYFKNMIRFITNIYDPVYLRKIFQKLLTRSYFIKIKRGKETLYHFNPNNRSIPAYNNIVIFD